MLPTANSTSSFLSQERSLASITDAHRSLYLIDNAGTKQSLDALKLLSTRNAFLEDAVLKFRQSKSMTWTL